MLLRCHRLTYEYLQEMTLSMMHDVDGGSSKRLELDPMEMYAYKVAFAPV